MNTPECDKLHTVAPISQAQGEFIDWLSTEKGFSLCQCDHLGDGNWYPINTSITNLLAEFHGIDLKKVEVERRAILDSIRKSP